ncbi:MAG: tail fiber domain-containing protein [Pseudomonadota bacterium]
MYPTRNALVSVLCLFALIAYGSIATAQSNQSISYQGYLTGNDGQAQLDPVTVEFVLYTVESGGTPVWSESQLVVPSQGLFSVDLGSALNPFPAGLFDTDVYLGIRVGTDSEMTPRVAFSSAPYTYRANRADDAQTLNGLSASDLDQSDELSALDAEFTSFETIVDQFAADVTLSLSAFNTDFLDLEQNVNGISQSITTLDNAVDALQSSNTQLNSSLDATNTTVQLIETNINQIESDITGLQPLLLASCLPGSAIRAIQPDGSIDCEFDDTPAWNENATNGLLSVSDYSVGIGLTAPEAKLQVDADTGEDGLRVRIDGTTRLMAHRNGSVSVGQLIAGPSNGMRVLGKSILSSNSPAATPNDAHVRIEESNWQFQLDNNTAGGSEWYFGSSADAWSAGPGKFVLSPTTVSSNAAVVVDQNRRMGLQMINPSTTLHIGDGTDVAPSGGAFLTLGQDSGANVAIDNNEIMARFNGSASTLSLNAEGGEVQINGSGVFSDSALEVTGQLRIENGAAGLGGLLFTHLSGAPALVPENPGVAILGRADKSLDRLYSVLYFAESLVNFLAYSDRRLKSNIEPIENALDKILQLDGVSYHLDLSPVYGPDDQRAGTEAAIQRDQMGFVAQDVAKVLPQLVKEDDQSGMQTVAYMGLIPVLVEGMKQQQAQITALTEQLNEQAATIDELKRR